MIDHKGSSPELTRDRHDGTKCCPVSSFSNRFLARVFGSSLENDSKTTIVRFARLAIFCSVSHPGSLQACHVPTKLVMIMAKLCEENIVSVAIFLPSCFFTTRHFPMGSGYEPPVRAMFLRGETQCFLERECSGKGTFQGHPKEAPIALRHARLVPPPIR